MEECGQPATSDTPLFQVLFVLQNTPMPIVSPAEVRLVQAEVTEGPSNFDLILSVTEFDRSLQGRIVYNSELFEEETIARIVNHFRILLSSIVADPSQCYWELPLMTEQEMSSTTLRVERHRQNLGRCSTHH